MVRIAGCFVFSPKQGRSCEFFPRFILRGNLMIHLKERRNSSDSNPAQRTASDWGWTTQNPKFKWTRNCEGLGPGWSSVLLKRHAHFVFYASVASTISNRNWLCYMSVCGWCDMDIGDVHINVTQCTCNFHFLLCQLLKSINLLFTKKKKNPTNATDHCTSSGKLTTKSSFVCPTRACQKYSLHAASTARWARNSFLSTISVTSQRMSFFRWSLRPRRMLAQWTVDSYTYMGESGFSSTDMPFTPWKKERLSHHHYQRVTERRENEHHGFWVQPMGLAERSSTADQHVQTWLA